MYLQETLNSMALGKIVHANDTVDESGAAHFTMKHEQISLKWIRVNYKQQVNHLVFTVCFLNLSMF